MRRWIILAVLAVGVYFLWRKFGGQITSTISNLGA